MLLAASLARTSGGGMTYLTGLLEALSCADIALHVITPEGSGETIRAHAPDAEIRTVRYLTGWRRIARDLQLSSAWVHAAHADVLIHPNDLVPRSPVPVITVVQNVGPFHPYTRREFGVRGAFYRRHLAIAKPHTLVTVSETARQFLPRSANVNSPVIPETVLFPSHTPPTVTSNCHVTIVTGAATYKDPVAAARMAHACATRGIAVDVVGVGPSKLPRSRLLEMFATSTAVFYPSRVESCGLPAVEAAGMGARPIVRSGTPMAELLGDVAVVLGDTGVGELAAMIASGEVTRLTTAERTRIRARFSPTTVAARWDDLFRSVCDV